MSKLTDMKNIGKEMESKLTAVGIFTAEALTEVGSRDAFFRLKTIYPEVCLVHLYTLQAAIEGVEFNHLSEETKHELKAFSDGLK